VSGGADGALLFWLVGTEKEVGVMEGAHEQAIWTLKWHPLGHILASGSNDNNTYVTNFRSLKLKKWFQEILDPEQAGRFVGGLFRHGHSASI